MIQSNNNNNNKTIKNNGDKKHDHIECRLRQKNWLSRWIIWGKVFSFGFYRIRCEIHVWMKFTWFFGHWPICQWLHSIAETNTNTQIEWVETILTISIETIHKFLKFIKYWRFFGFDFISLSLSFDYNWIYKTGIDWFFVQLCQFRFGNPGKLTNQIWTVRVSIFFSN